MVIDFSKYYWKNDLIHLRPPNETDWKDFLPGRFESEIRFFLNEEIEMPVDSESIRKRSIEDLEPGKLDYIPFTIENNEGKNVGWANIFDIDERNGKFGPIGIQINSSYKKMGYAVATYRMLGNYMFNERRMHKWNSGYVYGNEASEALHKKIGFIIEGIQKDMYFHKGKYWDQVIVGITEKQFFDNEKTF